MKYFFLTLILLIGSVSCDTVESKYKTLNEAKEDRLFEKGWLPDILPNSSFDIEVISDLDINTAEGKFYFKVEELKDFTAKVTPYTRGPREGLYVRFILMLDRWRGFLTYQLIFKQNKWVFSCDETQVYCKFHMWPQK